MTPDRILESETFLSLLDPDARSRLESRFRPLRVRKNQIVVEQGSNERDVYIVIEGELYIVLHAPTGREVYVRRAAPGSLIGEYAALDGEPRPASIVAATDALLNVITGEDFAESLNTSAAAAIWVSKKLALHVRALTERIYELTTLNARSRLHSELVRLSVVSGVSDKLSLIDPAPTHAALASRIGATREAVTRELNELVRMKIIAQGKRQIEVLDTLRLMQLVDAAGGALFSLGVKPHTVSAKRIT